MLSPVKKSISLYIFFPFFFIIYTFSRTLSVNINCFDEIAGCVILGMVSLLYAGR